MDFDYIMLGLVSVLIPDLDSEQTGYVYLLDPICCCTGSNSVEITLLSGWPLVSKNWEVGNLTAVLEISGNWPKVTISVNDHKCSEIY